ncbi:MAG TPA: tRNA pseudouridine(55) synthase TruB [Candidatus Limnocylindrales bacterium]|nr:tRNA pseudouridine(55) synthase TruB [Candidatus Limnocylindrales bacterium]
MTRGGRWSGPGLDGILVVDKPAGPTSHDVVALLRRLAATRRIGHGGTLDPFASGVLPLFLGRATRLAEYHLGAAKAYRATVCFGATSTTDDLEGELTPVGPAPDRAAVEAALPGFVGTIRQRPPAYSAIKVAGRRAYAAARAGERPTLPERDVTVTALRLVDWEAADPARPIAIIDVECAAGTYVRALARDLGAAVGGGAYLGALRRTRSGPFDADDAVDLDQVRQAAADAGPAGIATLLRPIDAGLESMPVVALDDGQARAIAEGQFVRAQAPDGPLRLVGPAGTLVAIGRRVDGRVAPTKVLVERG